MAFERCQYLSSQLGVALICSDASCILLSTAQTHSTERPMVSWNRWYLLKQEAVHRSLWVRMSCVTSWESLANPPPETIQHVLACLLCQTTKVGLPYSTSHKQPFLGSFHGTTPALIDSTSLLSPSTSSVSETGRCCIMSWVLPCCRDQVFRLVSLPCF